MTAIGIQDVGTALQGLIGRIAAGEQVLLTDGGKPVAMVVAPPASTAVTEEERRDPAEVVRQMLARRDNGGPTLGPGLTVRELIEEGRQ